MPYQFTAKNIESISSLTFVTEGAVVKGLTCQVNVNYGSMGMSHQIDLWPVMTPAQQIVSQNLYNVIMKKVAKLVMDVPE